MSITKYFLPRTTQELADDDQQRVLKAGAAAAIAEVSAGEVVGRKPKRTSTSSYDEEMRTKIGRHAIQFGNKSAVDKFSAVLGRTVPEATVRNFKRNLQAQIQQGKSLSDVWVVASGPRGRPLHLPREIDDLTKQLVTNLRSSGSPVSAAVVQAGAKGIISHKNPLLLLENGGRIEITNSWAASFLDRLGFVKRKGTRTARKVPADFPAVKGEFLTKVTAAVTEHNIPPSVVVNCDQTGAKMVPVNKWTMAEQGSRQVDVVGLDDKREMTVLLGISASGQMLPPQLIYAGKTSRCHPSCNSPAGWNVTHSDNHWSNEATMLEYIDKVLVPFFAKEREHLSLPDTQCGLVIWDVFAAHRCPGVLKKLEDSKIKVVFVPAGCTGMLQPLDLTVNDPFKRQLKDQFGNWYAKQVAENLGNGDDASNMQVDLRTSVIKPLHFQWLIAAISLLKDQEETLVRGFAEAGIADAISCPAACSSATVAPAAPSSMSTPSGTATPATAVVASPAAPLSAACTAAPAASSAATSVGPLGLVSPGVSSAAVSPCTASSSTVSTVVACVDLTSADVAAHTVSRIKIDP